MYPTLLFVHSLLRWLVLTTLILSVVQSARGGVFTPGHARLRTITVATFDTQVLLGILLYVVGPMTPRSAEALRLYMKVSALRFFTVEHPFAMIASIAVLHIFSAQSKRADTDGARHRRMLLGAGIALALVLIAIPWPGLPYARPLFRVP